VLKLKASGYINNNNLYVVGVANTAFGAIPFAHMEPVKGRCKNGPIVIGLEQRNPSVEDAIEDSKDIILNNILKEKIKAAVENLVERARQGDQNAIGILCRMRKNAAQRIPRAVFSYKYAVEYCKCKPINDLGIITIAGDSIQTSTACNSPLQLLKKTLAAIKNDPKKYASIISSHIANMDPDILKAAAIFIADKIDLVSEILNTVKKQNGPTFIDGYIGSEIKDNSSKVGFVVGYAKRLQDFRTNGRLREFSPQIAWELGE